MDTSNLKGALLEYLVRQLLANCGFFSVVPDKLYTIVRGGLFFINGRGAAHDADVLMEPPIQMPFTYPTRIVYECKAYEDKTRLPVVRNALGLRQDINEFEVITKDSLIKRQNNNRASYAIEKRNRYYYQVGVASSSGFSKPAIEFAVNNKIPLISIDWVLLPATLNIYKEISQEYIGSLDTTLVQEIYDYFKDRSPRHGPSDRVMEFLRTDNRIGRVLSDFNEIKPLLYVGLLEAGDLIFLRTIDRNAPNIMKRFETTRGLRAQIHYSRDSRESFDLWELSISTDSQDFDFARFNFVVPPQIMRRWMEFDRSSAEAINIKARYFSRIFIFNKGIRSDLPFFIVNIDTEWLNELSYTDDNWTRSD